MQKDLISGEKCWEKAFVNKYTQEKEKNVLGNMLHNSSEVFLSAFATYC